MVKALNLEKTLRGFTLDKLRAFNVIINSSTPTIESGELGVSLGGGTTDTRLGGVVSSLVRTRIENLPLVTVVTKTKNRQSRLRYNDKIAPKQKVKEAIKNIFADLK